MTFDPAKLRRDANGFPGRFFYDAERGDIGYIAKECDDRQCDCEQKLNADGDQDCSHSLYDWDGEDGINEPLVRMLNAVGPMLDEIERLSATQQQPPFYRELWHQLVAECQVLNEYDMQTAALFRIIKGRAAQVDLQRERLDHISTIGQMSEQLAAMTAARDELADIAEQHVHVPDYTAAPGNTVNVEWSGVLTVDTGKPFKTLARIAELRKVGGPFPRCQCTHEAGDSRCEVHPGCNECGEDTDRPVDSCAEHKAGTP